MKNSLYNPLKRVQKREVVTKDGSITLYSDEFQESYHSVKDGALNESLKKHIEVAFQLKKDKNELKILDICFGLGYNSLATLYYLKKNSLDTKVHILSPEFDKELVQSLVSFPYPKEFNPFKEIIKKISQYGFYEDEQIKIDILFGDAREKLKGIKEEIDIVFQDPFSPKKNPLLWTREYFNTIKSISAEDVVVTTYSVATPVRLALWEEGFFIYENPTTLVRKGTVASLKSLDLLEVDMELKLKRNRDAKALKDKDFL